MASKSVLQVEDAKESLQDLLRACRSAKTYQAVIEYLLTIYRKVQKHSTKNYDIRRLMKNDPGFRENVWRWSAAKDFLEASGWVEVSESLILPSYVDLTKACALLEKSLQQCGSQSGTSSRSSTSSIRDSPKRRYSLASSASKNKLRDGDDEVFFSTRGSSSSTKRPSASTKRSSTSTRRSSTRASAGG